MCTSPSRPNSSSHLNYSQLSRTCFSRCVFLASFSSAQTSHKIIYVISIDLGAHSLTARHVQHEQVHSHDSQRIYENYYDEDVCLNIKKPSLCHWMTATRRLRYLINIHEPSVQLYTVKKKGTTSLGSILKAERSIVVPYLPLNFTY